MSERPAVSDWATDFDHLTTEWAQHGPDVLRELRSRCPVAHTDRFHGAYLVTRYDDVMAVTHDPATFSSRVMVLTDIHPERIKLELGPLTLDPPFHGPLRRALLPAFSPHSVAALEPLVDEIVETLLDDLGAASLIDGASQFAERVPVLLMSELFGVTPDQGAEFRRWVDAILKQGPLDVELGRRANRDILAYFSDRLERRRNRRGEVADFVSLVLDAEVTEPDGTQRALTKREQLGWLYVLMIGGIDTTWLLIGAALFHLGTHGEDLARLVAEPELLPTAIEEFLRFFSPATVARVIAHDAEVGGCPVRAGQRVMVSFSSANRDEAQFERPDEVVLDRQPNRHVAFGVGNHRCIGSHLARMEIDRALRAWLRRFPRFELAVDPAEVMWSIGAIRGPLHVPLRILERQATAPLPT